MVRAWGYDSYHMYHNKKIISNYTNNYMGWLPFDDPFRSLITKVWTSGAKTGFRLW